MISCAQCGHKNELGRLFCYQCGARLHLNDVKPPREAKGFWKRAKQKKLVKTSSGVFKRVLAVTRVLILFGLVLVIVLMFIPPRTKEIPVDDRLKVLAHKKLAGLMKALDKDQT